MTYASPLMASLRRVWKNQRYITTKIRLYQSFVLSVLLHAAETWTLVITDVTQLETFHMKCQHQIPEIRWFALINNDHVPSVTGLIWFNDILAKRHCVIFVHVARFEGDKHGAPQTGRFLSRSPSKSPVEM